MPNMYEFVNKRFAYTLLVLYLCYSSIKQATTASFLFTKMAVFWVVAPCSLVEVYQRFRGPCCLHHQGDDRGSKDPEDSHLLTHRRDNLKFLYTVHEIYGLDTNAEKKSDEKSGTTIHNERCF
jgi:hypothetical protein